MQGKGRTGRAELLTAGDIRSDFNDRERASQQPAGPPGPATRANCLNGVKTTPPFIGWIKIQPGGL